MATRSFILRQNSDNTFSGRYHHWDGYPEGIGNFLHEHVNTEERINWLFGLNQAFSTMLSKPNDKDPSIINYPSFFDPSLQCAVSQTGFGDDLVFNNVSWEKADEMSQENYTYLFINNTWNVVLKQCSSLEDTKYMSVEKYILLCYLASVMGETLEQSIKNIAEKRKLHKSCPLKPTMTSLKKAMKEWADTPKDIIETLKYYVLEQDYDFDEGWVNQIDHICNSYAEKNILKKEVSPSKRKKAVSTKPRKL